MKRRTISVIITIMMCFTGLTVSAYDTVFAEEGTTADTPSSSTEASETTKETETTKAATSAVTTVTVKTTETAKPTEPAKPKTVPFSGLVPVARTYHNGDAIQVSWGSVKGAEGYLVYRKYAGTLKTRIANTRSLSCKDNTVASGKRAYYYVCAYNKGGQTKLSKEVSDVIYRVYVETGHGKKDNGKWDPGCRWKKYQEAKLVLPIAKAMARYLRANGVYVYTDADSGNNHNLDWTIRFLNSHSVSAFVNIHCDYRKARSGTLPLYRTDQQKKLAIALNRGVHSTVNIRDRGLKKRKDLDTLNSKKVHCASCLFETGAIKRDNKLLRTKYDAYGKGLAKGLCNYLNIRFR